MTRPHAVVTGLGAVSGFGRGVAPLWAGLVEGRRAVAAHPLFAALGDAFVGGVASSVSDGALASVDGPDRATRMALVAAHDALVDGGGLDGGDGLGVFVGTTLGGIGPWLDGVRGAKPFPDGTGWTWRGPATAIARAHGARGPVTTASSACASGNAALGLALAAIRDGRVARAIAGGVDALSDFVVAGFASLKALDPTPSRPFDVSRRGLNLGEGACFLVVEDEAAARARGARVLARLDGFGEASDAVHMTGPDREGRGAARAMQLALDDAGVDAADVDFVSTHGTATHFNDAMEARAFATVFGARAPSVPMNSIKGALGHTLGAAGAFEALVCICTIAHSRIAPTAGLVEKDPEIALDLVAGKARERRVRTALSTSSGFGGLNAAIVVRAP